MIIASEQVGKGHPDKIADQISDIVLQKILEIDSNSRVACETLISSREVFIRGEIYIPKNKDIPYEELNQAVIKFLKGLNYRFDDEFQDFDINIFFIKQSQEINNSVHREHLTAGDQGIIFGFASNETKYFLPIPYVLATLILNNLDKTKFHAPNFDAKSQVAFDYDKNEIYNFLVSIQHEETANLDELRIFVKNEILLLAREFNLNENFDILINPSGSFVVGGPKSDIGLTGRKIIADTYGGFARHGGGAFSGKDFTKVDRSAAYMMRYIAKNIVAHNLADKVELQVSYAIGVSEPISINVNTFNSNKVPENDIIKFIKQNFDLTPDGIRKELNLDNPKIVNYPKTTTYGHFMDLNSENYPWEFIKDKKDLVF